MHTLGPWHFDGHGINSATGERIVTFQKPPATAPRDVWMEWVEFSKEIGPMLAAVSELLEACEIALDVLGCDRVRVDRLEAQEIIHKAINKAKGG